LNRNFFGAKLRKIAPKLRLMAPQWKPEGLVAGEPQKKSKDLDFLRGPISRNFPKKKFFAQNFGYFRPQFRPISPELRVTRNRQVKLRRNFAQNFASLRK